MRNSLPGGRIDAFRVRQTVQYECGRTLVCVDPIPTQARSKGYWMNLQQPNASDATQTKNRALRSVVPQSGLCARCVDGCQGNCEVFQATFRGRELIYNGPFGEGTAGRAKNYTV